MRAVARFPDPAGRQRWKELMRRAGLLLALTWLSTGCLSRPTLSSQSFSFALAPPSSARSPGEHVLSLGPVRVASPFEGQSFVYRTGEFSYERDPYAGFLVPPSELLAEPLRAYFHRCGPFREVVEPGSGLEPDMRAEVSVDQLFGDFRNRAHPKSVLKMHFIFFNSSSRQILLSREYSEAVALNDRTAAAVMAGWNKGLEAILSRVCRDLESHGG